LAVKAMARAGFDPAALVRYVQRVQAPPTTKPLSFEPTRDERVSAMNLTIEQLPALTYEEIQERIPRPIKKELNRVPPKLGQ
jgi:predicted Zn-dependent protease